MEQIPEPFLRQVQIDPVFLGPGNCGKWASDPSKALTSNGRVNSVGTSNRALKDLGLRVVSWDVDHEPSASDACRRIVVFFDEHLSAMRPTHDESASALG